MSNFQNMTAGDVAAEVIGSLKRGEVVNSAALDDWFRDVSMENGFELIKDLTSYGNTPRGAAPDETEDYRHNLRQLNVRLAQQPGFIDFMRRLHESREASANAHSAACQDCGDEHQDSAETENSDLAAKYDAVLAGVPSRTTRGFVERVTRQTMRDFSTSWYEVNGVKISHVPCAVHEGDITQRRLNGRVVSVTETLRTFLGDNPDQWLGHLADVEYLHSDDVNAALRSAGLDELTIEGTEIRSFKIID